MFQPRTIDPFMLRAGSLLACSPAPGVHGV